jgi:hypothetical protein
MTWRLPRRSFTHDLWAPLSHIPEIGTNPGEVRPLNLPTWVDDTDARRLMAYRVLAAYRTNVRRFFLPDSMWQSKVGPGEVGLGEVERPPGESWREYGHGALLVETARSIVLGEDQTVVVPDGSGPGMDWLVDWAGRERLKAKLLVQELNSVGDGDGVLVLAWSPDLGRPTLRTYDPGFYFPDLLAADTLEGWSQEFPPIVHLAWEYERPDGVTMLRRHSWRMERLATPVAAPWGGDRTWTCRYEAAEWEIQKLRDKVSIYTLAAGAGRVLADEDLEVDFIPVVHVPNTENGRDVHFGSATPLLVAQILDDLSGSDTDLAKTAETSAAPAALFTGAGPAQGAPAGPGSEWWLQPGANAEFVDTSRVLDAGLKHKRTLLEDLAVNSRLALSLLGRIDPSSVPSGYAFSLGFGQARSMLRQMRLVRDEKHPLILRFAHRLAQARGAVPRGETPDAQIDLGPGLPSDRAVAIEEVKTLLQGDRPAISTATAVRMLMAAGLPIEDADAEVKAIRAESYAAAVQLVDALGDTGPAYDLLDIDKPEPDLTVPVLPPAVPPVTEPPAPNGDPE